MESSRFFLGGVESTLFFLGGVTVGDLDLLPPGSLGVGVLDGLLALLFLGGDSGDLEREGDRGRRLGGVSSLSFVRFGGGEAPLFLAGGVSESRRLRGGGDGDRLRGGGEGDRLRGGGEGLRGGVGLL